MEKLSVESLDITQENINKIKELFPNVVTEGKIDFEALKTILGEEIDDKQEKYQFTWNGKRDAIRLAQMPSTGTLRPDKESSKDWDTTENLYIEGDNLEVLKLLQKSYYGKIKMIYIDPPYNTGGDFVYKDDFKDSIKNYKEQTNQTNQSNPETNGRYHTDWLNMMYPRLVLARNLLSEDGIIFISIDDNEITNINKMLNDIYGENNFVAQIIIDGTPKNDPYIVSTSHEYCLVYVKNKEIAKKSNFGVKNRQYFDIHEIFEKFKNPELVMKELQEYYKKNNLKKDNISNYKYADSHGVFRLGPIDDPQRSGAKDIRINPYNGLELITPSRGWSCSIDTWNQWIQDDLIYFSDDNTKLCSKKTYIDKNRLDLLRSYYKFQTRKDTNLLELIFGEKVFSFPKPLDFIKLLIESSTEENDIVLDFFAGSGTTAHGVISLNNQDNFKRKFIMVQLPENLEVNLKSTNSNREKLTIQNAINYCNKNSLKTVLTEISKERIKKCVNYIGNNNPFSDNGFKCFKLDSTCFNTHDSKTKSFEDLLIENTFDLNRSKLDILYEIMLKYGVFDKPVETLNFGGKNIFSVSLNYMLVIIDEILDEKDINKIIELKPEVVIFDERCFKEDNSKMNIDIKLKAAGINEVKSI